MKCCICSQNLDGQPAIVDHATGEAFCPRDSHYFGLDPSNRPHRTTIQETKHEPGNENKQETKMTESLQPTDDEICKSMKILNNAYLCRVNPELDKQIEAALASVLTAGEKGVQVLLDRLYDGVSLSGGTIYLKDWGDYTWNELLKKREIIRALQKSNSKSAGRRLKDLLSANCRTGQWAELVVPALRSAIEAIDASARQNEGVPPMSEKTIDIEATSLEEARKQIRAQIPEGLHLLSEKVISDGKPKTIRVVAETTETAFAKAQSEIPSNVDTITKKEISAPSQSTIMVEAFDEQSARTQAENLNRETTKLKAIRLVASGKKGLWGIGKKPSQYEAEIFQQAIVEVTYKQRARVSATIGKKRAPTPGQEGYCQMCGKKGIPFQVMANRAFFLCSKDCENQYGHLRAEAIRLKQVSFTIDTTGMGFGDHIRAERQRAYNSNSYCWFCGKSKKMGEDFCSSCGSEADAPMSLGAPQQKENKVAVQVPEEALRLNTEAKQYHDSEQFDKAIEFLTKAIQIAPQYADAYNNLAAAFAAKGQGDKALSFAVTMTMGTLVQIQLDIVKSKE